MDEEERKYLNELKKQINPEVLQKMAEYLGDSGSKSRKRSSDSAPSSPSTLNTLAEKRAASFQERVKQRKIQASMANFSPKEEEPKIRGCIIIYSTTSIWMRILQNLFSSIGFQEIHCVDSFKELVYFLLQDCHGKECLFSIAVNSRDISKFLISWENLKRSEFDPSLYLFLDQIKYFCVVESTEQAMPALNELIGSERILLVKDSIEANRTKMMTALGISLRK